MRRRAFLAAAACLAPLGAADRERGSAVARAAEWLWSRQGSDGAWHSDTYGLLRPGVSLTGLVANALLDASVSRADPRLTRALAFLAGNALQPRQDYPVYSAALALRALRRSAFGETGQLDVWLRGQQLGPANGWSPDHPAYGAWGIGGLLPRRPPDPGHIDISMTRHAVEALVAAGAGSEDPALRDALVFLRRCRTPDGGSLFSTTETGANKAGDRRAYGTATADNLIASAVFGPAEIRALAAWLKRDGSGALPAGFPNEARERYARGLRYYWADAAARSQRILRQGLGSEIRDSLLTMQSADGAWRSEEPLVKEDDPLIATAFAVSALAI